MIQWVDTGLAFKIIQKARKLHTWEGLVEALKTSLSRLNGTDTGTQIKLSISQNKDSISECVTQVHNHRPKTQYRQLQHRGKNRSASLLHLDNLVEKNTNRKNQKKRHHFQLLKKNFACKVLSGHNFIKLVMMKASVNIKISKNMVKQLTLLFLRRVQK